MINKRRKIYFFYLTITLLGLLSFNTCDVPAPSYSLPSVLNFACSTDYDPNDPSSATWSDKCTGDVWLSFWFYTSQPDFSGWNIYFSSDTKTSWDDFSSFVDDHIKNGILNLQDTHVVPNTDGSKFSTQEYPTIYIKTAFTFPGDNAIVGLDNYNLKFTQIVIPPIQGFSAYHGALVVAAADYINYIESSPSNIIQVK